MNSSQNTNSLTPAQGFRRTGLGNLLKTECDAGIRTACP